LAQVITGAEDLSAAGEDHRAVGLVSGEFVEDLRDPAVGVTVERIDLSSGQLDQRDALANLGDLHRFGDRGFCRRGPRRRHLSHLSWTATTLVAAICSGAVDLSRVKSRRANFWIFPLAVLGRASTTKTLSGTFCTATPRSTRNRRTSSSDRSARSRVTTKAQPRSPVTGSGPATTATSTTSGCSLSWFSTSYVLIFSPERLMMSLIRPTMWMPPRSS